MAAGAGPWELSLPVWQSNTHGLTQLGICSVLSFRTSTFDDFVCELFLHIYFVSVLIAIIYLPQLIGKILLKFVVLSFRTEETFLFFFKASVCLCVCVSVCVFVCPSVCLSVHF